MARLQSIFMVESVRETGDRIERETRFYIMSLALLAVALGPLVRDHWAVENGLHWVMDMVFRDDECRVRKDHAPANFTTIKRMASNLMRNAAAKGSMRLKRKAAAWDDDFLASLAAERFLHPIPLARRHSGAYPSYAEPYPALWK